MEKVVIVSAVRTPIGSFGGAFKSISAVELGVIAGQGALEKINLAPEQIDEIIIGNVLGAGLGQNVARQISLKMGIPVEKSSFTVDMVCGSGLKSVVLGTQSIQTGNSDIVLVGGTENMSQAPYLNMMQRWGSKMGNSQLVDSMLRDGLTDALGEYHMGLTAENIAESFGITREEQDVFALDSQLKTQKAQDSNKFKEEIVPVYLPNKKGEPIVIKKDEYPRRDVSIEKIAKMRPAFKKDGTVTAANSSGINDGAAMMVLMSESKAKELGLKILGTLESYASAGVAPELMGTGPVAATKLLLQKTDVTMGEIDLIEANEAFASQSICVIRELGMNPEKVNVNGGAIALGHPIGASGTRILVSLVHEMIKRDKQLGLATLCIGGGQGTSVLISR